jgi:hypothetical protein
VTLSSSFKRFVPLLRNYAPALASICIAAAVLRVGFAVQTGGGTFAYLRSSYVDRDVHFANEYADLKAEGLARVIGSNGYPVTYYQCGTAALWLPFVALADVVMMATGPMAPAAHDGFGPPYYFACTLATYCYAVATVLLVLALCWRLFRRSGVFLVAAAALGTPFLFYSAFQGVMPHVPAAFTVALLLWAWIEARENGWTWPRVVFLGAVAGLALLVDLKEIPFLALPLFDMLGPVVRGSWAARRAAGARSSVLLAVAALVLVPQLACWYRIFGVPWPAGGTGDGFGLEPSSSWHLLLSTYHGVAWWTPVMLLALIGLVSCARRSPIVAALGAVLVARFFLESTTDYWAGMAFGPRRLTDCFAVVAIGLGGLYESARLVARSTWPRRAIATLAGLAAAWSLALAVQAQVEAISISDDMTAGQIGRTETAFWRDPAGAVRDLMTEPGPGRHVINHMRGLEAADDDGRIRYLSHPSGRPQALKETYVASMVLFAATLPFVLAAIRRRRSAVVLWGLAGLVLCAFCVGGAALEKIDGWAAYPPEARTARARLDELARKPDRIPAEDLELLRLQTEFGQYEAAIEHGARVVERTGDSDARFELASALVERLRHADAAKLLAGGTDPESRFHHALATYGIGLDAEGVASAMNTLSDSSMRDAAPGMVYPLLVRGALRLENPAEARRWLGEWRGAMGPNDEIRALGKRLDSLYPGAGE